MAVSATNSIAVSSNTTRKPAVHSAKNNTPKNIFDDKKLVDSIDNPKDLGLYEDESAVINVKKPSIFSK